MQRIISHYAQQFVVGILTTLLCACANVSDANRTRAEGASVGAVSGAILGKLTRQSDKATLGIAVAGAGIGLAVGDKVARDKERYVQAEDRLRASIAATERSTQEARQLNANLAADISTLKRRQDLVQGQYRNQATRQSALVQSQQQARRLMDRTQGMIAAVDRQLAEQRSVLAESRANSQANLITVAEAKIDGLDTERQVLAASLEQLRLIDQRRAY